MKIVHKRASLLIIMLVFLITLFGCTKKTSSNIVVENVNPDGKLTITVMDQSTKKPVSDAKIVIVGADNTYNTNDKGVSPEISLKINKDIYKKYGDTLLKTAPSGSATIIVFKEGYKDYVYFNKSIYPGNSSNNLKIEISKPVKNDSQKYVANIESPHDLWVQELIQYCKNVNQENQGIGENKVNINVKDSSSKAVEGASIIIPELGIKTVTDKNGKCTVKLDTLKVEIIVYPVKRQFSDVTIVTLKEGYLPAISFNTSINKDKENNINIALKPGSPDKSGYIVKVEPYEKEWVENLIGNYKK